MIKTTSQAQRITRRHWRENAKARQNRSLPGAVRRFLRRTHRTPGDFTFTLIGQVEAEQATIMNHQTRCNLADRFSHYSLSWIYRHPEVQNTILAFFGGDTVSEGWRNMRKWNHERLTQD